MSKRPTIATVAKLAGVSPSTVSFVLNKRENMAISEQTKAKVLAVVEELDYRPSPAARMLASSRTYSVLLLVQTVHNPIYTHFIDHIQDIAQDAGYRVVIAQSNGLTDWTAGGLTFNPSFMIDGILACAESSGVESFLKIYPKPFPPIVGLGFKGYEEADDDRDFVDVDRFAGASEAVHHLLSGGRSRIAYMVNAKSHGPGDIRGDAYRDIMAKAGFDTEYIITRDQTKQAAREAILDYMSGNRCPEGIFCTTDELAMGAHRGLSELGIRMPDDVALVGYGDISDSAFLTPSLSTVSPLVEESCKIGWEFLENRMKDSLIDRQKTILQPKLIIRETSGG